MYAQLSIITLGPGTRSAAEKLVDQFAHALQILKGIKRVTFIGDERFGDYGALSLWEPKEDAEAATAVVSPQLEQAASSITEVTPTRRFFEVYEPKG